jgi:hypothetical protein
MVNIDTTSKLTISSSEFVVEIPINGRTGRSVYIVFKIPDMCMAEKSCQVLRESVSRTANVALKWTSE